MVTTFRQARLEAGALALCTVALVGALTACGGDDGATDAKPPAAAPATSATPPGAPTGPASPADPAAAGRAAALEVYSAMWAERTKAYRQASSEGTDLERYATLDALRGFERDLSRMKENDTVFRGELRHAPEVTVVRADARPPTATVEDCVDLSRWRILDTTTGWPIPLPSGQPLRQVATATVERGDGGRWMVTEYTADTTRTC